MNYKDALIIYKMSLLKRNYRSILNKIYKSILNKKRKAFEFKRCKQFEDLHRTKPKDFLKYLRSQHTSCNKSEVPLDEFNIIACKVFNTNCTINADAKNVLHNFVVF